MILPLYGEFGSKTALHDVGAVVTTFGFHISTLAPQPCGMPYIWPLTEFHGWFFRNVETVA